MSNYHREFGLHPRHIFNIFITNACIRKQYIVLFYVFLKMHVNGIITLHNVVQLMFSIHHCHTHVRLPTYYTSVHPF